MHGPIYTNETNKFNKQDILIIIKIFKNIIGK